MPARFLNVTVPVDDLAIGSIHNEARELDQQLQLSMRRQYYENWANAGEKWIFSGDREWYFILPNGQLHKWAGGRSGEGELVGMLHPAYHDDPSLLHEAADRTVFEVNSFDDAVDATVLGDGIVDTDPDTPGRQVSLRAAIQESNALAGRQYILLDTGLHQLSLADPILRTTVVPTAEQDAETGDLDIFDDLTIVGAGSEIDAEQLGRVIEVGQGADVRLSSIVVRGGRERHGGGILNAGELALQNVTVFNNEATDEYESGFTARIADILGVRRLRTSAGGGIFNASTGTLTIDQSNICVNRVEDAVMGDELRSGGGGVFNDSGNVLIRDSRIESNFASEYGGGVATFDSGSLVGHVEIINTDLFDNEAGDGGGLYVATENGNGSTGSGNGGDSVQRSVRVAGSSFINNQAGHANLDLIGVRPLICSGAGIFIESGSVVVDDSTFRGNTSGNNGGGIFNRGLLSVRQTTFTANTAGLRDGPRHMQGDGGAIHNGIGGIADIQSSSLTGSRADHGGAILNAGVLRVTTSQFSNNTADSSGGAVFNRPNGTATILTSSFSRNRTLNVTGIVNPTGDEVNLASSEIIGFDEPGRGGAVTNLGDLVVASTTLRDNASLAAGGAIWNHSGTLQIVDTEIVGNEAYVRAGGIGNLEGSVSIHDSVVSNSIVRFGTDPVCQHRGTGTIACPAVIQLASAHGGGISNVGQMSIHGSDIESNSVVGGQVNTISDVVNIGAGGGIVNERWLDVSDSRIANNTSDSGGGISNSGQVTLESTVVESNVATLFGGGLFNTGAADVRLQVVGQPEPARGRVNESTFRNNRASAGGGIWHGRNATFSITRSTLNANTANTGGAIWNEGNLFVLNSTVSGNHAVLAPQPHVLSTVPVDQNPELDGAAGGVYSSGSISITYSTITENLSAHLGAAGVVFDSVQTEDAKTATLFGSIVYGNRGCTSGVEAAGIDDACLVAIFDPNQDLQGPIASQGYNLIGGATHRDLLTETDLIGVDPQLGPLADNGGPTRTHRPLAGSPAVDHVEVGEFAILSESNPVFSIFPNPLAVDQRDFPRPVDGDFDGVAHADIGAVETQTRTNRIVSLPALDANDDVVHWNPVDGAASYAVWFDNLTTRERGAIRESGIVGTSFAPANPLTNGDRYRVWVQAVADNGRRLPWSRRFDFVAGEVDRPELTFSAPPNSRIPLVTWKPVDGAKAYDVTIRNSEGEFLGAFGRVSTTWFVPDTPLDAARYTVSVVAVAESPLINSDSVVESIDAVEAAPSQPRITSPSPDRTTPFDSGGVTFAWTGSGTHFELYLRNTQTREVIRIRDIHRNSRRIDGDLAAGPWKVWARSFNRSGERSAWSASVSFVVDPSGIPVPGKPAFNVGESTISDRPRLAWNDVDHAAEYLLLIINTDTNTRVVREPGISGTSYHVTTLLQPGTYQAWVIAQNSIGASGPWSDPFEFEVPGSVAPVSASTFDSVFSEQDELLALSSA